MTQESQIINYIASLDHHSYGSRALANQLFDAGYRNAKNEAFTEAQINSLVHSVNQKKRKESRKYVESCGIDRKANPCGDASDY